MMGVMVFWLMDAGVLRVWGFVRAGCVGEAVSGMDVTLKLADTTIVVVPLAICPSVPVRLTGTWPWLRDLIGACLLWPVNVLSVTTSVATDPYQLLKGCS